jgi:hypothetical protein
MCAVPTPSEPWRCCARRPVAASEATSVVDTQRRSALREFRVMAVMTAPMKHMNLQRLIEEMVDGRSSALDDPLASRIRRTSSSCSTVRVASARREGTDATR